MGVGMRLAMSHLDEEILWQMSNEGYKRYMRLSGAFGIPSVDKNNYSNTIFYLREWQKAPDFAKS